MVKPVAAAVAGALIAGVAMYTVGAKTARVDAFQAPALVQTVDGGWVKAADVSYSSDLQPATSARLQPDHQEAAAVRRVATRTTTVAAVPAVYREEASPEPVTWSREPAAPAVAEVRRSQPEAVVVRDEGRDWKKTAMIIGGSAAGGAGIGGIAKGKKGALIGAAIGGGAASIYEATRRR
jgi:hypothetical protein